MNNITLAENTLGQRIKAQRIRMGYTQEQLAEIMCVPKTTISTYERDACDVKSSVIVELAGYLDTTPNYLLGFGADPVTQKIAAIIGGIEDEKVKEMLLLQVQALAGCY